MPFFIIVLLSLAAWFAGLNEIISFNGMRAYQHTLEAFILEHYFLSLLGFFLLYVTAVSFSIPVATVLTLSGGLLFGQWVGTASVVLAATCGACIVFLTARLASKAVIQEKAGPWLKKMQKGFQDNALSYLLTLRLIPIFPFVAINLGAAVFQIPFKIFFWGTLIGIIPGSFIYVSMGVALRAVIQTPDFTPSLVLEPKILFALIGLGILSLLPVVYKYFHSKSKKAR